MPKKVLQQSQQRMLESQWTLRQDDSTRGGIEETDTASSLNYRPPAHTTVPRSYHDRPHRNGSTEIVESERSVDYTTETRAMQEHRPHKGQVASPQQSPTVSKKSAKANDTVVIGETADSRYSAKTWATQSHAVHSGKTQSGDQDSLNFSTQRNHRKSLGILPDSYSVSRQGPGYTFNPISGEFSSYHGRKDTNCPSSEKSEKQTSSSELQQQRFWNHFRNCGR